MIGSARVIMGVLLNLTCLAALLPAQSKVYRGDPSNLPPIDPTKTVEMKEFEAGRQEFKVRALEMKALDLPTFVPRTKSVSTPEWQSPKPDVYAPSIDMREVEIRKAIGKWSQASPVAEKTAPLPSELGGPAADRYSREAPTSSETVETQPVDVPATVLGEEELKRLINRGAELPAVDLGRGASRRRLPATEPAPPISSPKTESPPKSAPSK